MAEADTVPYGRKTQQAPPLKKAHVIRITAGLGCDGDPVSIAAATRINRKGYWVVSGTDRCARNGIRMWKRCS